MPLTRGGPPANSRRGLRKPLRGELEDPACPRSQYRGSCRSGDRRLFKEKHLMIRSLPGDVQPCRGFSGSTGPVLTAHPPALPLLSRDPRSCCDTVFPRPSALSALRLEDREASVGRQGCSICACSRGGRAPRGAAPLAPHHRSASRNWVKWSITQAARNRLEEVCPVTKEYLVHSATCHVLARRA